MTYPSHQELLKKYAEVIVRIGLNLRKGQGLVITNSVTRGVTPAARSLVHEVTKNAYTAGAKYVEVLWGDEEINRIRIEHASKEGTNEYPKHIVSAALEILNAGGALLTIKADDPDGNLGLDPDRIAIEQKIHLQHYSTVNKLTSGNKVNWCVAAAAAPAWGSKVFPNIDPDLAVSKLWDAIFEITRTYQPDPISAWEDHISNLSKRTKYLQSKKYDALHYKGPDTDLKLGLPKGHLWVSAKLPAENGIEYVANIPTEEIFTMADRNRAEGVVKATFPLSYAGSLIEDFSLTFQSGRITKISAHRNESILQKLVDTDEGSHRLGEVALVPANSPIGKRGHLFYNTLFDENASCHLAIGYAYPFTMTSGNELNQDEFISAGGNVSLNHVDFMIGSPQLDINGIKEDGTIEPIMRNGDWAFDI